MRPEDIEDALQLKYEYVWDYHKITGIILASLFLNVGVIYAISTPPRNAFIASLCLTGFVWVIFGAPIKRILTEESQQKLEQWMERGYIDSDSTRPK